MMEALFWICGFMLFMVYPLATWDLLSGNMDSEPMTKEEYDKGGMTPELTRQKAAYDADMAERELASKGPPKD